MTCRVCGAEGDFKALQAREMMFGLRHPFEYFQCSACLCLQIAEIPKDLAPYYPEAYYSFSPQALKPRSKMGPLMAILFRPAWFSWLKAASVSPKDRILDIGAGSGSFLRELYHTGFQYLTGLEPFLKQDLHYAPGFDVLKQEASTHRGQYDFISSQHSLEHMPDQQAALKDFHRLLARGRMALVRIPVCDGEPFEIYRENWVQLDAPRHFYLHSKKSFTLLAEKAGFRVEKVLYDSNDFSFWGSEQYRQDIPLQDPRSWGVNRLASIFTRRDVVKFRRRARKLNKEGRADSACFFLRKI